MIIRQSTCSATMRMVLMELPRQSGHIKCILVAVSEWGHPVLKPDELILLRDFSAVVYRRLCHMRKVSWETWP